MPTIAQRIIAVVDANGGNMSEFARRLGVTPAYISKLRKSPEAVPSDRTIMDICREYNVNERWLRTGEGEMFNELSRDEQITRFVAKTLRESSDSFRKSFMIALSELPDEAWPVFADFILKVAEAYKKSSGQPPDQPL